MLRKIVNNDIRAWEIRWYQSSWLVPSQLEAIRTINCSEWNLTKNPNAIGEKLCKGQTNLLPEPNWSKEIPTAACTKCMLRDPARSLSNASMRHQLPQTMTYQQSNVSRVISFHGNVAGMASLDNPLQNPKYYHANWLLTIPWKISIHELDARLERSKSHIQWQTLFPFGFNESEGHGIQDLGGTFKRRKQRYLCLAKLVHGSYSGNVINFFCKSLCLFYHVSLSQHFTWSGKRCRWNEDF